MIKADKITKSFGSFVAVDQLSLDISKGVIFGLLGPNAAGKTTTIRILCGITNPDNGTITINGTTIDQAKKSFGYVAQSFGQYEELTVWENISFYASMYGVTDNKIMNELLERYQLMPFKKHRAGSLSGGYKRRLALVCALCHDPQVLFLDEPTAGIDPVTRKQLWDDFYELSARGKTIFITTHYMEEAQRCHELAFITHGKIIARGTPETITDSVGDVHVQSIKTLYTPELSKAVLAHEGVILVNQFGKEMRIMSRHDTDLKALETLIHAHLNTPTPLLSTTPNLEDAFIALTQGKIS